MTAPTQVDFTFANLTISPTSLRAPYHQRTDENKLAIHWGQRKLLLSEVEFFTLYWDQKVIPTPLCVYAGAAPGTHIPLLSEMFPFFLFHLYDPSPFDIKETEKIKLYNEYFTEETARRYANRSDVFFISDIRTADYKALQRVSLEKRGIKEFDAEGAPIGPYDLISQAFKEAETNNEDQIWGDMTMQQTWVTIINPEHALLKLRFPYALDGKDRIVTYLKGIIYWQAWPPQTSTETRLKPIRNANKVYDEADWNILEYEQWCFYHNTVEREQIFYKNIFTGTRDPVNAPELLNDYDSMAEAMILKLYLEKVGVTEAKVLYEKVKTVSNLITWSLNHYRTDDQGAQTLAKKRASPVKSSNKAALDAFRAKRKGKQPKLSPGFQHTNPTRRQLPIMSPVPGEVKTSPIVQPINVPVIVRTPPVAPKPVVITPTTAPKPVIATPTTAAPKPMIATPTTAPKQMVITPTIKPVVTTPAAPKPVVTTPAALKPVTNAPAIKPLVITAPAIKPVVTTPGAPKTIVPLITPITVIKPTIPTLKPLIKE